MFNKKGKTISDHLILFIPKSVYLAIAFLSVVFLLRLLIITNIDTSQTEAKVLTYRIYYSPNILTYIDSDTGRAYPGMIDLQKFQRLETSANDMDIRTMTYGAENRLIAAKLILKNLETNSEDIVFYNKDKYEYWEPRVLSTVEGGSGSVKSFTEQKYALIKNADKTQKGILKINVIIRK